ncbi:cytochrome P450 [Melanogaster broomeanus]|nr:cytochrome P450 [Melanogaster broomeanus]
MPHLDLYHCSWLFCALFAFVVGSRIHSRPKQSLPLPPGPSFLTFVRDYDGPRPWLSFTTWASTYGKVFYFSVLSQNAILLNTEEAARALLEQRSSNYADRPLHERIREVHGLNFSIGFLPYGDEWRLQRKVFHNAFRSPVMPVYWSIQMRKAHELVQSLIEAPNDFLEHVQTFAASTIMSVVYGYEVSSTGDPYVNIVERATYTMTRTLAPTRVLLLLLFPFLPNIPTWAPGGGFRRRAMELKEFGRQMIDAPFRYVQDAITASTLKVFFLAMVLYPEAQRRAQAEIDAVVGNDRLPTFEDRPSMPFLEATLRETLRWHPVAPLGVARQAREADSFDGYHIPKGATVLPNVWAMTHDDVRYPDPNDFKPERFLNSDGTLNDDAVGYVFGFGRRICPGRHFADASLWAAIASVLAVLKIEKPAGQFTEPKWILGQTNHPGPFLSRITPRVPERQEVLVGASI